MARESTVKHAVNYSGGVGGEASRPRSSMQGEAEKRGGIYLFTTEREREAADESKCDALQSVREGTRKEKKEGRSVD